jgi:trimethylamine--corrinoid protein Co-methyltransferase
LITCGGTLDSTMLESDALLLLDDELCGAALRIARGIEVNDETLALDLIRRVGASPSGNYLAEAHTVRRFRHEHFIPELLPREAYEVWLRAGALTALDRARERVRELLAQHQPRQLNAAMEEELDRYRKMVAARTLEDFLRFESDEFQSWTGL